MEFEIYLLTVRDFSIENVDRKFNKIAMFW